jgi:transglutaminase-like putative cysteine protease
VSSTTQARLTLVSVTATMLAALTLSPLVRGKAWLVAVFVLVAVVAGVGSAVRQVTRSWFLVALAQLAALVLAVTALFVQSSALWGVLPGPAAWAALADLVELGAEITRQDGPPVEPAAGLILLVAGGLGLVGLAVDVIAVSLRKPAVAGLPLLAVYCVPAAVLSGGVSWGWFVLAGLGYILLIAADATDRIRGWGRVLGNLGPDGEGRVIGGGPLSGARRIGVGALAVAVLLPPLVPGLGEQILGAGSGDGEGRGNRQIKVLNPILDLRENLNARSDATILTYRLDRAATAQPLRIVADTRFDGKTWSPPVGREIPADNRAQEQFAAPPGLGPTIATRQHKIDVGIRDYEQNFLPLPYPTFRVDIEGKWLWDSSTLNVVGDQVSTRNSSYSAFYLGVSPTPEQLDAAGSPPASVVQEYTALPADFPDALRAKAAEVAGDGSGYEKATKLQKFFRSGEFTYDTRSPAGTGADDGSQDVLLQFLDVKRGYCVHFASAMAVMARSLRIPARVAVGFLPGKKAADGSYEVSLQDAHAWPELYFEGTGWVRFEPTPAGRAAQAPGYTAGLAPEPEPTQTSSATQSSEPSAGPTARRPDETGQGTADTTPVLQRVLAAIPWRVVLVLVAMLLLLFVPLLAATVVRRRRWSRATTATARAEAAWDDLRERLADLDVRWASSWTPRALEGRLVRGHALGRTQQAALGRLVEDLEQARYMPPGAPGRGVDNLADDVRTVAVGVAATVPKRARRRARWFPTTGVSVLGGLARNVDAVADEAGRRASALGEQVRQTVGAGRRGGDGGSGGGGDAQ